MAKSKAVGKPSRAEKAKNEGKATDKMPAKSPAQRKAKQAMADAKSVTNYAKMETPPKGCRTK